VESGRSLPAKLTRAGVEILAATDTGVRAAEQRLMTGLSAEQRREFRRILAALGA
jgi:DNA-binding MarR family transcriptional regulator